MAGLVPPEMPEQTRWPAGKYVLTEGRYMPIPDGPDFRRGDVLDISSEVTATRLGNAGILAPLNSLEARRAAARDDKARAEVRLEELEAERQRLQEEFELGQADEED